MDIDNWFSLYWFFPSTIKNFTWAHPYFLYGLFILPFVFLGRWIIERYTNQKLRIAITQHEFKPSPWAWIRLLPGGVLLLCLILLLSALARPQLSYEQVDQWSEGIDIMIALDISQSMQIEDFKPNRLEAAKEMAHTFIKNREHDRIGLVIFSGEAFSLAPLTTDYELLYQHLLDVSFDMIDAPGTAIGSALSVATNRMRESESKSKVCILLSDGDNTSGNIDPIMAARLASAYNIKLYTIVVGKEGLVPMGKDWLGNPNMVENTVDESTMKEIAEIGQGEFFRVTDNMALKKVFSRIDKYEQTEIKETRFSHTTDFYTIYLKWGLLCWLFWLMFKSTFIIGALQD